MEILVQREQGDLDSSRREHEHGFAPALSLLKHESTRHIEEANLREPAGTSRVPAVEERGIHS
jgi:hypothetical protein